MKKDMIIRFMLDAELDTRIREYCEENDMKISYFFESSRTRVYEKSSK